MLALRQLLALGPQHRKRADEDAPGLPGVDDVVDVAALGCDVRVGEPLGVLLDELGALRLGVGRGLDLLAEDDADRTLRTSSS